MTEHHKGLARAQKLCLALSIAHTCTYNVFDKVSTTANTFTHHQNRGIPRMFFDILNTLRNNTYEVTNQ